MKTFRYSASRSGFTLIELMIALLIGVFLMAGVIQIFLSAKQAYRLQENLSRLQENGRASMDFLTKDIRMAGYVGCASKIVPNSILDPTKITIPALTTGTNGVDGVNVTTNSWGGVANPTACGTSPANQCIAGTDVISFQSASTCGAQLKNDVDKSADLKITTPNTCGVVQGDVVILSNCTSVDIFAISNNPGDGSTAGNGTQNIAHGGNLNINPPFLGNSYSANNSEILVPQLSSYYIRSGSGGIPSLYRVDNTKTASTTNPVELIEGIENMQILYGVDTDAPQDYVPNYYVDASKVTNWTATPPNVVVSVRVSLLAVTIENNLTDAVQPYFYNGATVTPPQIAVVTTDTSQLCPPYSGTLPATCKMANDFRLRRVFSSTIAVRNRLL